MRAKLTNRQREVLEFIVGYSREHGYPPTVREIMEHLHLHSTRSISDHLEALQRKGYLHHSGTARGIRLADGVNPDEDGPPIVGNVSSGEPLLAVENRIGTLSMAELFGVGPDVFTLRVEGEGMLGAGIFDGDFVVVREQTDLGAGEIGVAFTEEGATVKRVFDEGQRVRLQPENPAMQPTYVTKGDPSFHLAGKVVGVVRRLSG